MRRPSWLRWPVSAEWADTLQARGERAFEERDAAFIVNDRLTRDLTAANERHALRGRAARRILAAWAVEKRRADSLQRTLDTLLGLDHPAVAAGATWQDRREKKMRFDA